MASRFWPVGSVWCDRAQETQSHHVKHRTQKPCALAQPQPKHHAQHQRRFDRQIGCRFNASRHFYRQVRRCRGPALLQASRSAASPNFTKSRAMPGQDPRERCGWQRDIFRIDAGKSVALGVIDLAPLNECRHPCKLNIASPTPESFGMGRGLVASQPS